MGRAHQARRARPISSYLHGQKPCPSLLFDPRMDEATDRGRPWVMDDPEGKVARAFAALPDRLEEGAP